MYPVPQSLGCGVAPRIANLAFLCPHLLDGVARRVAVTNDPEDVALLDELRAYPVPADEETASSARPAINDARIGIPVRLRTPEGELCFFSTIATFGTAIDINVAELSIESFFPADAATAAAVKATRQPHRSWTPPRLVMEATVIPQAIDGLPACRCEHRAHVSPHPGGRNRRRGIGSTRLSRSLWLCPAALPVTCERLDAITPAQSIDTAP